MSVTIDGSGTITGISAGGLPDGSITNDDLAGSITDAKLSGTTCKAWVNFNGTSTVAIRASYNVSSITDNGTGDYTVNFTSAMTDGDYAVTLSSTSTLTSGYPNPYFGSTFSVGSFSITIGKDVVSNDDATQICAAVFR